jgi:tRNA (cytidine/uridine-2'-O-)-methyltransferase
VQIVLVQPEIPHNTGCAGRLAAATGVALHLVEPLGFSLDDRYLKRAGLDYWPLIELVVHASWSACAEVLGEGSERPLAQRLHLFSARGGRSLFETDFAPDDVLVFGSESSGLPAELLERHAERRVYVPIRPGVRSLNLANAVCLAAYTALVRAGLCLPDNAGTYAADARSGEDLFAGDVARRSSEPGP